MYHKVCRAAPLQISFTIALLFNEASPPSLILTPFALFGAKHNNNKHEKQETFSETNLKLRKLFTNFNIQLNFSYFSPRKKKVLPRFLPKVLNGMRWSVLDSESAGLKTDKS